MSEAMQEPVRTSASAKVRRMGRPRKSDSVGRREDVMSAALVLFASHGYAETTLAAVAREVGLTQPALYHYFPDKRNLYEAVFMAAIERAWTAVREQMSQLPPERSLLGLAEAMDMAGLLIDDRDERTTNIFLTTAPIEATRHPELHHLLKHRSAVQDREIRAIVLPAFEAGLMPAFDDVETAVRAAQLLLMGWAIETFTERERTPENRKALRSIIEHLAKPVSQNSIEPDAASA